MAIHRDRTLPEIAAALRSGALTATALVESVLAAIETTEDRLNAYRIVDAAGARKAAHAADARLAEGGKVPPFCGIPVSVKDLYGVAEHETYAGSTHPLPERWTRDAWLVARLREQGAVIVGKTHTVEFAYGGIGINPNWETPRNPWDAETHRIPGGSSSGAGVSLSQGSALVALGSDTGGSIRIPASMTGNVGQRVTAGRWPTDGVVPLSSTLDTVGGLTRCVEDQIWFFGAVDPSWGDPQQLEFQLAALATAGLRLALPTCGIWDDCQPDIARVLRGALEKLKSGGWGIREVDGGLLDEAYDLYMTGAIAGAECITFLKSELPEWVDRLAPIVGKRLAGAPGIDSEAYKTSIAAREALVARAGSLFDRVDVLALPTAMMTPPPVSDLSDLDAYRAANAVSLRPTGPISMLGLCAISIPIGLDDAGMPVGLQLVAPGGSDEALLGAALSASRTLGAVSARIGRPPGL